MQAEPLHLMNGLKIVTDYDGICLLSADPVIGLLTDLLTPFGNIGLSGSIGGCATWNA